MHVAERELQREWEPQRFNSLFRFFMFVRQAALAAAGAGAAYDGIWLDVESNPSKGCGTAPGQRILHYDSVRGPQSPDSQYGTSPSVLGTLGGRAE